MRDILLAEWTKFRTVRSWIIGMIVAAILIVFFGVFLTANAQIGCMINGVQKSGRACLPKVPIGPGGEAVQDQFFFVHQSLTGNGTITAELTSLTGMIPPAIGGGPTHAPVAGQPGGGIPLRPGLVPWGKAGIILKQDTKQGSAYAAMLDTASHGVRMQYNYTGDIPGMPGRASAATPRWLRLVRSGDTVTGYDSADGRRWTKVDAVTLAGLPSTVQVGLFAASPNYLHISAFFGGASVAEGPSTTTGTFDRVSLTGGPGGIGSAASAWTGTEIGGPNLRTRNGAGQYRQSAGEFTVTGSGDIAPVVPGPGGGGYPTSTIESTLAGGFAGLIAICSVAALFFTSEYRRGLIRATLAASPSRGRVLAAKAIVAGLVTFVIGLVACIAAITLGLRKERGEGQFILPVPALTDIRVIAGTAAMFAVIAVLAVALGAVLRRSAVAITIVIAGIVLPFLLAVAGVFPDNVSNWILRLTPAAGYAIEQSIPAYHQLVTSYSPAGGQYPLSPLAGFGVLCLWTAAAYALALFLLRRRDA